MSCLDEHFDHDPLWMSYWDKRLLEPVTAQLKEPATMNSKTAIKDYKAQIDLSHPADGMYYEAGQFWDEDKGPTPKTFFQK